MNKLRNSLVLAAASALLCLPMSAAADTTVKAKLVEVNGSGASGTATLTALPDGGLKVVIHSEGLVPGVFHPQHIHGTGHGGHFMCPTQKNDSDGDGVITNEEGTGEYGAIFFPLTTRGGVTPTPTDALAADRMPVADANGRISYERTFSADMVPDGLLEHISSLHVVQHGIDANDNGKYDLDALGVSTFAENLGKPRRTGRGDQPGCLRRRRGGWGSRTGARRSRDRRCPSPCPECTARCSGGCTAAAGCGFCGFRGGPSARPPQWPLTGKVCPANSISHRGEDAARAEQSRARSAA